MNNEALHTYVYQQIQAGLNPDEISAQLRASGWDEPSIAAAFKAVSQQIVPSNPAASPVPQGQTTATFQANGKKRGRIKTGWLLMKQSLKVLKNNKELVRYPFIGGMIAIFLTIIFIVIFIFGRDVLLYKTLDAMGETQYDLTLSGYAVAFVYYVLSFFAIHLYSAGMAAHVLDIFKGKSEEHKHYMSIAWSKRTPIFVYSVITTTVGFILSIIEERARWLGYITSRILGAVWKLANLFTIPVIIETDSSAPSAIKQSSKLFISRWGENISARVTFGGIMFLVYLLVVIPVAIVLGILASYLGDVGFWIFIVIITTSLVAFITLEVAASNILNTALYYYAKYGQVPAAFSAELLNATIIPRKKSRFFGKKQATTPNPVQQ